jgi:hypothetical protein
MVIEKLNFRLNNDFIIMAKLFIIVIIVAKIII